MQLRLFRQVEQAGVAVEEFLVVVFTHAGGRELARGPPYEPERPAQRKREGKTANDPIANVHAHEGKELGRDRIELFWRAAVALPVEQEGGGEDAAAGHGRDVRHLRHNAGVAEEADQAEVVQTPPKTTPGTRAAIIV